MKGKYNISLYKSKWINIYSKKPILVVDSNIKKNKINTLTRKNQMISLR
jgi:hypothetical protein